MTKDSPSQPAAPATKPATATEPAQPPATPPAKPGEIVLDFDKPASQGFDPSLYMGVIENASPVYHFISTTTKRHFCTIKEQEKYDLLDHQSKAWKYQGIAFFAYPEGRQPPDARPVYRFWSQSLGHHFYTMDEATKDLLIKEHAQQWRYDGIAWYAPPAKPANPPKK